METMGPPSTSVSKIILLIGAIIVLNGCIATSPPKPPLIVGNPDKDSAVKLYFHDSKNYPGQPFKTLWTAHVVEFDGKPTKGFGHAEVKPGIYQVKMSCWANNMKKDHEATFSKKIELPEAGNKYFPYATTSLWGYDRNGDHLSCQPDLVERKYSSYFEVQ